MSETTNNRYSWAIFVLGAMLTLTASGCAIGTTRVKISHAALDDVKIQREGNILVKRFTDAREDEKKPYIGNKRNMYGMVLGHIGVEEGVELDMELTGYFVEALRAAGYNASLDESNGEAPPNASGYKVALTGEIQEFWLDLYMAVWHTVKVTPKLVSIDSGETLWETEIEASESNTLWVGARGKYEKVINQATTMALNKAAEEFASEEFHKHVNSGN